MVVGPGLGKDSVMIRSVYLIMQEIRKQVCTAALGLWFLAFVGFARDSDHMTVARLQMHRQQRRSA